MPDRATEAPRLVAAGWAASTTFCVEQKRRSQRRREGAGFIGSSVAVYAPRRPRRQRTIVVAQVRCDRMLAVVDRTPQITRFTELLLGMRQAHNGGQPQADRYARRRAPE
ncbi:hypothetical protein [Paraburkholderia youngii]|uniref:hypothetical protein n=1 Tax=Paraburkholderia youngii TaxID=2782701 RepID=UPI003D1AC37F